ncbi:uncharacterized protein PV07_03012 [Cladophialophora immunda]|uniref:Uncharacterized protein n=1 Tax=Cladophialophora immunda TaxID=569365 RepID=A0A0D1ZTC2_9EURO|nr:uncharacterized protein PV07_03012 [Cladophialophora immunda]KIW31356.1 hypothetical protein PV07_03012 [Cladophialophora immunda]
MDHFSISFSTPDEGHQPLASLVGLIDSPPELEIRYPAQMGFQARAPIATPMDQAHAFQPATWRQVFEQSRFPLSSDNSQTSQSHRQTSNSNTIMASIMGRHDIAAFRDTVCSYLRLTSGLWTELYNPREDSTAHHLLKRYLCQEYGRLPPDLWDLLKELRDQYDFENSRYDCIDFISSLPTPAALFPQSLASSGSEERDFWGTSSWTAPRALEASSSRAAPMSSPGSGREVQTRSTTSVPAANGRRRFQSPSHQRARGRAPKGVVFRCSYEGCRHDDFRNAGNIMNHISKCHAESPLVHQHPATFMVPASSPQPSNQGDATTSVVTNASDPTFIRRRLSQEYDGSDDGTAAAGDDGVRDIGDIAFTAEQDELQVHVVQGVMGEGSPGATGTSGLESSSLLEAFTFVEGIQGSSHYPPQHEVRYGQLQIMEDRRWETGRRG